MFASSYIECIELREQWRIGAPFRDIINTMRHGINSRPEKIRGKHTAKAQIVPRDNGSAFTRE